MVDEKSQFYDEAWQRWQVMIDYSPAPKHRRRIIRKIISDQVKNISSVVDVGCGNGRLLAEVSIELGKEEIEYKGFDISELVIEQNKDNQFLDGINWQQLNLDEEKLAEKFDLVLCSELLEHLQNWKIGLDRLLDATGKYLIVTIPSGYLYKIDRMVGHQKHFTRKTIETYFVARPEFSVEIFFWGFPFHQIYKRLINLRPNSIYNRFAGGNYSCKEKMLSNFINLLFYLNIKTQFETSQMILVAQRH
jgi:2-polyprenyl-3-methyl-5-hydroxy-6-metoxy-1,4-benzoquinol methylase